MGAATLAVARGSPASALVPPAAADRGEALFFYGTLTDPDVLARVLGRAVDPADLEPATLAGFDRVGVLGASYPVLVPAPGASVAVDGLLFLRATRRDIARINRFEGDGYRAEAHDVRTAGGGARRAWLYLGVEGALVPSGRAWALEAWRRLHKPAFLAACADWAAAPRDRE